MTAFQIYVVSLEWFQNTKLFKCLKAFYKGKEYYIAIIWNQIKIRKDTHLQFLKHFLALFKFKIFVWFECVVMECCIIDLPLELKFKSETFSLSQNADALPSIN